MNDENKSLNTGQGDDAFNEEFDFGEGNTENNPIQTTTTKKHNKKAVGFIFIIVLSVVLIMGYRIYAPKPSESKNTRPAATTLVKERPITTNKTNVPETAEELKKQSDEFAAALSGMTPPPVTTPPPAAPIPAPMPDLPKPTVPVPTPITAPVSPAPIPLHVPEIEKTESLDDAETAKLHEGLNKLNNQIDSILSQIKYLDAYSREVSDNLNKLNESISVMDNRILTLTNTTSSLSKDVGTVKSEMGQVRDVLREDGLDINPASLSKRKPGRAEKEDQITIAEPEYTVHAVVPGRAWLKSVKGQIVTVAEGDSIGNYGKILVIDAANGIVLTSSGVAFR